MNTGTLETELSDHHALIYTMLKTQFVKLLSFINIKNFNANIFIDELSSSITDMCTYDKFEHEELFTVYVPNVLHSLYSLRSQMTELWYYMISHFIMYTYMYCMKFGKKI